MILPRWSPLIFLGILVAAFGALVPRFLSAENLGAILVQSSWLIVVASGLNFALLTAGVDLSVGSVMYLAAVTVALGLPALPVWVGLMAAALVGAVFGAANASLIVGFGLPPFIVTLATLFVARGIALFASSTRVIYANAGTAHFGRSTLIGIPMPLCVAVFATAVAWIAIRRTPWGLYVRSMGADSERARRAGVPTHAVTWSVYALSGAFAAVGGVVSLSQTAAASSAFGQHAEFLAIAAAVLGGTSLLGGRGTVWAPVIGAILIMTVQNGLVMVDANPYAYPVLTGGVIFLAALMDSLRSHLQARPDPLLKGHM